MTDETPEIQTETKAKASQKKLRPTTDSMERMYKRAVVLIAGFLILTVIVQVSQSAIYKIHEYERGLHLRGGKFINVDQPGWHVQIPLVDTVVIVKVNERLGYIERIQAMTSDDVAMDVSLQYTYRVTDPERFALEVDDPERIVFEFVQGKLRDVINTKPMAEVMQSRAAMNQEVTEALVEKEAQYGVKFVTVQMQSASPPEEVVTAIKDRMVAVQRQEQAQAEATQKRTLADAEFYASQREADAEAYQIAKTTEAQQQALHTLLQELEGKGTLAEQYIQFMIAQELKNNSKWIISSNTAFGEGQSSLLQLENQTHMDDQTADTVIANE